MVYFVCYRTKMEASLPKFLTRHKGGDETFSHQALSSIALKYYENLADLKLFLLSLPFLSPPPFALFIDDLGSMVDLPSPPPIYNNNSSSTSFMHPLTPTKPPMLSQQAASSSSMRTPDMLLLEVLSLLEYSVERMGGGSSGSRGGMEMVGLSDMNRAGPHGSLATEHKVIRRVCGYHCTLERQEEEEEGRGEEQEEMRLVVKRWKEMRGEDGSSEREGSDSKHLCSFHLNDSTNSEGGSSSSLYCSFVCEDEEL